MDDAAAVGLVESAGNLTAVTQDLLARKWSRAEAVLERVALEVLHDQVIEPVVVADVEQRADMRLRQTRDDARLLLEALAAFRIGRDVGGQDLQRHHAAQACVARAIDLSHAALSGSTKDLVRSDSCSGRE